VGRGSVVLAITSSLTVGDPVFDLIFDFSLFTICWRPDKEMVKIDLAGRRLFQQKSQRDLDGDQKCPLTCLWFVNNLVENLAVSRF